MFESVMILSFYEVDFFQRVLYVLGKAVRLTRMKTGILILVLSLFPYLWTLPVFSQPSAAKFNPGMRPPGPEAHCGRAVDLNLSPEQMREFDQIQQTFMRETQLLRAQLFAKRIELRESLTNPTVKAEFVRSKYGEIAGLELKVDERNIDFLIKLRSILTPDQLKNWCPEKEFPSAPGMRGPGMMDPGSRPRPFFRQFDKRGNE